MHSTIRIIFTALALIAFNSLPINLAAANNISLLGSYESDIAKIEKYLNEINSMVASFDQITPSGGTSDGMFYLSKPGKIRWEYYNPDPLIITARGKTLTHFDVELDQISYLRVDDTLTNFLTKDNISFSSDDIEITNIKKTDDLISITLSQVNKKNEGEITLNFTMDKIAIDSINVTDAIDKKVLIKFSKIEYDKPLDKKLFIISKFN